MWKSLLKQAAAVEAILADEGWILRSFQPHYLITSLEK